MLDRTKIVAELEDSVRLVDAARSKLFALDEIVHLCRKGGRSTVFTKGVFDVLHEGHLHLIKFCSELKAQQERGILVIGIASDSAVRECKGLQRPINGERERASQIAAIEQVDYVVIFDSPYPVDIIKQLRPLLYVKGADTALTDSNTTDTTVELEANENNPEIAELLKYDSRMIVFLNRGGISTTVAIRRVLEKCCRPNNDG